MAFPGVPEMEMRDVVESIDLATQVYSGITGEEDGTLWLLERRSRVVRVIQPVSLGGLLP